MTIKNAEKNETLAGVITRSKMSTELKMNILGGNAKNRCIFCTKTMTINQLERFCVWIS